MGWRIIKLNQCQKGGYAAYWNDEIDISEHELWLHSILVP